MDNQFEGKVHKFINRHQLLEKGARIVVGVSGGPDSLSLLYYLCTLRKAMEITVVAAHVDHMFRGEESFAELRHVERICKDWNVPFEGIRINVPEEIEKRSGNPQAISREVRYGFYRKVMNKYNCSLLALAHHGDDQIETILMRLTRGATTDAAAGIKAKRTFSNGYLIRPFLCVTKAEIEDYAQRNRLVPVYDPSNKKDTYTRNRFRKTVLPFLKRENKNVHIHFQRFSEELSADNDYLMSIAKERFRVLVEGEPGSHLTFNILEFMQEPLPLQRRCIHLILNYLYKDKLSSGISAYHIDAVMDLVNSDNPSSKINLPNQLQVVRSYQKCTFTFDKVTQEPYIYKWEKGETLSLPNGNKLIMHLDFNGEASGEQYFILDKLTPFPLFVRTRREGDKITLKGSGGSKKLKSLFIDQKVPINERNVWPIVTDTNGEILWVPLLKKSQHELNINEKENAIVLQYKLKEDF